MGLTHIKVRRETIKVDNEQSFDVRGLSASDILYLVEAHGPALALAYGKMMSGRAKEGNFTNDMVRDAILSVAKDAPELLAALIAAAADDYNKEGMVTASMLPFDVQLSALVAVFTLSMSSEAQLKKLLESLTDGLAKVSGALTNVTIPSLASIGESAAA